MRAWVLLILGLGPALIGLCADDDQTKEVWIESTKAAPSARAKWSVEAEHYNSQAQVVNDADARNGRALYAQQGVAREWYMTTATYSYQELYGRYRFTFRVKTSDNTTTNPVIAIGIHMQDGVAKENVERVLRGADFRQANQYEDFTVEMLRGDSGYPAYLMWYRGGADVWVDCITIERTGDVTDKDLAELYGVPAFAATPLQPASPRALVVEGLFHAYYQTTDALDRLGVPVQIVPADAVQGGFKLHGFPKTWEKIAPYSILLLNDVDPRALGYHGRALVKTWVEQGGVFIVTGGPYALGKGLTKGTLLGDTLPVAPTGPWELIPGGRIITPWSRVAGSPRYRGRSRVPWLHQLELRPDAQVVATAGGHPVVVFHRYGAGIVAVLNLTTLDGDTPGRPFWKDPGWTEWLAALFRFLTDQTRASLQSDLGSDPIGSGVRPGFNI